MKHTIRFIILFFALVAAGTDNVRAITADDIIFNILPNNAAGTVSNVNVSEMMVTFTATATTGYSIDADHITAEKMVDAMAPRRTSGMASKLDITDNGDNSFSFTIPNGYTGAYVTVNFYKTTANGITSLADIPNTTEGLAGNYVLTADVDASGFESLGDFTGTLDGGLHKIIGLSAPLFASTSGSAIIRNIIFEDVNISVNNGDAGAVTGSAGESTRIYNCGINPSSVERDNAGNITGFSGSTVSGSGNVGGLVGTLSDNARVINCYSYANITGGTNRAGIVGNNSVSSTQASLTTMVMNCMFYGDISTGGTISPIYGGVEINNVAGGLNNYNYYRYRSRYSVGKEITDGKYNRALAMEEKFITRFERYRLLLNSNKKLAAIYATGSAANADQMAKWVLETADRTIVNPLPYPVLKLQGKNPSIINYDADHAPDSASVGRLNGGKLGKTLAVTIRTKSQKTTGGQTWPTATGSDVNTTSLTLIRTDKDTTRFNFNYDKVQLPYYNDVGTGNYTESRVVTGWKITDITGGTAGEYKAEDTWGGYNFADRNCTKKDKYDVNGRVFSQGAYWDVPEGVTAITIEPYWAIANYVSDATYDVVYDKDYNKKTFSLFGTQYENDSDIDIYGDGNNQKVYNTISDAIGNFSTGTTVYDQAVVLVGNVHQYANPTKTGKAYTVMSIDMNHDNEPDYSYIFTHDNRKPIDPIRYDFLNIMGMAEAQIPNGATLLRNVSIFNLKGWFEITNTCVVNFSQFEYENSDNGIQNAIAKSSAPLILQGGTFEQFVSTQKATKLNEKHTQYIHIGSNVWFAKFGNGTHSDGNKFTPHIPISVTGGDYDEFYLSGTYQPNITNMESDNAECYISGGRFGEVAGASMEAIDGDVQWDINWADITNFYGGGVNAINPITGKIQIDITNSYVNQYCGGPKFGDMVEGKTVTTNATDCVFGTYFGAGYGGNAYKRLKYKDASETEPASHQGEYANERGKYYNGTSSSTSYGKKGKGVATDFDYEFFIWSTGQTGSRFYVNFITFSLATTRGVTSNLTKCKVTGNVYGGGSLGKVDGNVSTTLNSCEIIGNVFGGGYSATLPKIGVRKTPAFIAGKEPKKNMNIGMFEPGEINTTEEYEWKQVATTDLKNNTSGIKNEGGKNYVYTDTDLSALGTVTGNVTLNINGTTTVGGSVYGGGEESGVDSTTTVSITGGTIGSEGRGGAEYGNVYGGGKGKNDNVKAGLVKGNTNVKISGSPTIYHNVYGGGAYGSVGDFEYDANTGMPTGLKANTTGGKTEVYITGGTFGWNGKENGMVFGSSRGDVGAPNSIEDKMAWVYDTHVIIGDTTATTTTTATPVIKGSVYGGGENGHNFRNSYVRINGGTIGVPTGDNVVVTNSDNSSTTYEAHNYPYRGNVYGGGCGTDKYYSNPTGVANLYDGNGDKYNAKAGVVQGNAYVNITAGHIVHNVYGAGAMGSVGTTLEGARTKVNISGGRIGTDGSRNGNVFGAARGEYGISTTESGLANVSKTEVNISYTTTPTGDNTDKNEKLIAGSVFGGGEAGTVKGSVNVNMTGGLILKDIYGGGALADTQTSNWDATANENTGGWATGMTSASNKTTVRLTGGTILGEAYGGGLGEAGKPAYVYGDVLLDLNGTTTSGEEGTAIAETARGCAVHQVFGCNNINGTPMGDVKVHVYATQNKITETIDSKVPLTFTEPAEDKVTYWSTQATNLGLTPATIIGDATTDEAKINLLKAAVEANRYDVLAVYGGGNLSAYEPVKALSSDETEKASAHTNVIIDGCGYTSIQQVYGGGNAASTPATNVTVNGTYEIEEVFGGGNGKDKITVNNVEKDNPGANVGFYDYSEVESTYDTKEKRQQDAFTEKYIYGSGKASVNIWGGKIHRVFGGSNTKGNVRITAVTMLEEAGGCDFCVDEAYGGGKSAPMDAEAKLLMACIPGLQAAYGGAEAADIQGNVTLNITNGTFDRVFGGNNLSGTISGSITVNIEEIGCRPIIIGELYGGGNDAPYSVYGYKNTGTAAAPVYTIRLSDSDGTAVSTPSTKYSETQFFADPQVNVKSFTSIGNIYGGGYGKGAVMVGNPTVNINEVYGKAYVGEGTSQTYTGVATSIGTIQNVFGGGNAAEVKGNTNVNIGTETDVFVTVNDNDITVGTTDVSNYYIRSGAGTKDAPYKYDTKASGTAQEGVTYYEKKTVVGVNIRGNVYGGGNNAAVTGNTNVQIGKRAE